MLRARVPAAILAVALLSSCASGRLKGDREFIHYWPPPAGHQGTKLAVKDVIDMKGVVTTGGSQHYAEKGIPAARDAECLRGARERGVTIVGRTNLTELAMGASGLNHYFGTPRNRLNGSKRLMPGGSSSGSAVAVANGKADIAFGTDTAGSIRTPAACCGIYGLKTTFGLVSLKGVMPLSPKNLDTVGPMARDVEHLAEGMDLLKPGSLAKYHEAAAQKPSGRSITVGRLYIEGTHSPVDEAVDAALRQAGFKVVRLPESFSKAWEEAKKHGDVVAVSDGYKSDHDLLGEQGVTATTKAAILLGDLLHKGEAYKEALRHRPIWQHQLRQAFQKVDFIALPTLKRHPMRVPMFGGFVLFEAEALAFQNTVAVNYAGNPAVAIPIPVEDKRVASTSLQLIGPRLSEAGLLNAARIVESKVR